MNWNKDHTFSWRCACYAHDDSWGYLGGMSASEHIFIQLDLFSPSLGATHRNDSLLRYANVKREGPLNGKVDIFGLDDNRPLSGLHGVKRYRAKTGVSGRRSKQACGVGNIPC